MLARYTQKAQTENSIAFDVPFRGSRDYAHPTDMFCALSDLAGRFLAPRAYVKNLTLRRKTRRQIAAQFQPHPDAFGTFTLALPNQFLLGFLVERQTPITRHVPYDESVVSRLAIIEPGRISLPRPVDGYSAIEQTIILFKLLCGQSHPRGWLFTSIDLDTPLRDDAALAVNHVQTVLGRLIDAGLHQDGQKIGRLRMVLSASEKT